MVASPQQRPGSGSQLAGSISSSSSTVNDQVWSSGPPGSGQSGSPPAGRPGADCPANAWRIGQCHLFFFLGVAWPRPRTASPLIQSEDTEASWSAAPRQPGRLSTACEQLRHAAHQQWGVFELVSLCECPGLIYETSFFICHKHSRIRTYIYARMLWKVSDRYRRNSNRGKWRDIHTTHAINSNCPIVFAKSMKMGGGTVVQWFALLFHNKKVLGLYLPVSVWSLHVLPVWCALRVVRFPPTVQEHAG